MAGTTLQADENFSLFSPVSVRGITRPSATAARMNDRFQIESSRCRVLAVDGSWRLIQRIRVYSFQNTEAIARVALSPALA